VATLGFEEVQIAILNDQEQVVKVHKINAQVGGAVEAKISGLAPTTNTVYASNVPFYVSAVGVSNPKLELNTADLTEEMIADISGAKTNENGITTLGADTVAPYCAVIMKTKGLANDDIYIALAKGKFGHPDGFDLKTGEDKGQEADTTDGALTGEFVARHSDGIVYAKGRTSTQGFTVSAFTQLLFPGWNGTTAEGQTSTNTSTTTPTETSDTTTA